MNFKLLLLQLMLYVACFGPGNLAKVVGHVKDNDDGGTITIVDIQDDNKTQYLNQNFEQGNYNYGYDIKPSGPVGQFHHENKSPDNVVYGCYGHEGPDSRNQMTFYISDAWGYRPVRQDDSVEIFYPADNPEGTGHMNGKLTPWSDLVFPDMCAHFAERIASSSNVVTKDPVQLAPIPPSITAKLQSAPPPSTSSLVTNPSRLSIFGGKNPPNTPVPAGSFEVIQFNSPNDRITSQTPARLTSITPIKNLTFQPNEEATGTPTTSNTPTDPVSNNIIPNRFNTGVHTGLSRGTSILTPAHGQRTTALPTGPSGITDVQSSNVGALFPSARPQTTQNVPINQQTSRGRAPSSAIPVSNTRLPLNLGQTSGPGPFSTIRPRFTFESLSPLSTQAPIQPSTLSAVNFEEASNNGPLTPTVDGPLPSAGSGRGNHFSTVRTPLSQNVFRTTTLRPVSLTGSGRIPTNRNPEYGTRGTTGETTPPLSTSSFGNPTQAQFTNVPSSQPMLTDSNPVNPLTSQRPSPSSSSGTSGPKGQASFRPLTGFSGIFNNPNTLRPSSSNQQNLPNRSSSGPAITNTQRLTTSPEDAASIAEGSNSGLFLPTPQPVHFEPRDAKSFPRAHMPNAFTPTIPQEPDTDTQPGQPEVPTSLTIGPFPATATGNTPSHSVQNTGTPRPNQDSLSRRPIASTLPAFGSRRLTGPSRATPTFSPRIPAASNIGGIQQLTPGSFRSNGTSPRRLESSENDFCASQCSSCQTNNKGNVRDEDFSSIPGAIVANIAVIYYPDCSENAYSRPAIVPFCPAQKTQCKDSGLPVARVARKVRRGRQHGGAGH